MANYICRKPCSFGGVSYLPGDSIPLEAVLPRRAGALVRLGLIGMNAVEEQPPMQREEIAIPIRTADGETEIVVTPDEVRQVIAARQASAEEALRVAAAMESEDALIMLSVVDSRREILAALQPRIERITIQNQIAPSSEQETKPPAKGGKKKGDG